MNPEIFNGQFKHSPFIPYDNTRDYLYTGYIMSPDTGGVQPFEYTGWRDEELSWHENCYIHAGLNPMGMAIVKGPDALRFLDENFTNSFKRFPVGTIRHGIMVNAKGTLMNDGILFRTAEDEYVATCLSPFLEYRGKLGGYDIEFTDLFGDVFMFQLGGPRSLEIVEAACGEDLHDIGFLHHRKSTIDGHPVRILRIGMAGSLAYEVHGHYADSIPVYEALLRAGEAYGLRRLGRHAYWNTHTENGFPQLTIHFPAGWLDEPDFLQFAKDTGHPYYHVYLASRYTGSMGSSEHDRYVNPYELGWEKAIDLDHDFHGRDALAKLKDHHRTMVTLEWNVDDILDIQRSGFETGEPYAPMDGPEDCPMDGMMEYRADKVLIGGDTIGASMGRIHSWYYRKMISLALLEPGKAKLGDEVEILWGDEGTRQKRIRATVARYPYMDTDRNENVDVNRI